MNSKGSAKGLRVVICGGSQGIGLETAREFVRRGASVCLVARNEDVLQDAASGLRSLCVGDHQFVDVLTCDTTDHQAVESAFSRWVEQRGVPEMLVNAVGAALPQYVEKLGPEDFRRSMEVNYHGQVIPTLVMLPHFRRVGSGHIAHVSSMMGYFAIMGYAAYAPAKFAIAGFAEALRNELKPEGITFSLLYPPDTDTPGFARENLTKPDECRMMSEGGKLMSAEAVARVFVDGLLKRRYHILPGDAGLVWRLNRFFPALLRWMLDRSHHAARKKLGKSG